MKTIKTRLNFVFAEDVREWMNGIDGNRSEYVNALIRADMMANGGFSKLNKDIGAKLLEIRMMLER